MDEPRGMNWAAEEFKEVDLGDKRLDARLICLCDRFSDAPESPISQACSNWAETKAAYRFFRNENVDSQEILTAHRCKTVKRAGNEKIVLAVQDTSYFVYTHHPCTEGLGRMSLKEGKQPGNIHSKGLMMHICMAVTTEGVPLGLLDQKIFARKLRPKHERRKAGRHIHDILPVEEKSSYRWLESLITTHKAMTDTRVVTVCDREADLYDLFKLSDQLGSAVLIRASANRTVNRKSRYAESDVLKLWEYIGQQPEAGSYTIDIPRKGETHKRAERDARKAVVTVRFWAFQMNPPCHNPQHGKEPLPDITMNAIYVLEPNPPDGEEPVEWMLLTNLQITSFDEACEKVKWYGLRWRIEMYFKVLKSGFRVEACRLEHADRLARYLTVMSIVAWRLFQITLVVRTDPAADCSTYLSESEWKVLTIKATGNREPPQRAPTIGNVVIWVAKLGGYLARKSDGPPGTLALWRGWKRLTDLTEGWTLATKS